MEIVNEKAEKWQRLRYDSTYNPNNILGFLGIFLEIAGFALTFHAVKPQPDNNNSKVSFTPNSFSKESFTARLIKRMTEIHLRLNLAAAILVIIRVV